MKTESSSTRWYRQVERERERRGEEEGNRPRGLLGPNQVNEGTLRALDFSA